MAASGENRIRTSISKEKQGFTYLPAFARFLLNEKLEELAQENLRLMKTVDFHLMQYFDTMPEEKMLEFSKAATAKFLTHIIENDLDAYISSFAGRWKEDQLRVIARNKIVVEDIPLVSFLRKKSFLQFLPEFTTKVQDVIFIVEEFDEYILNSETVSFQTYIDIKDAEMSKANRDLEKTRMQFLEAEEIAGMGSFEWDLQGFRNSSFSPNLLKIFELSVPGNLPDFLNSVHADDVEKVETAINKAISGSRNYECEYRYCKSNKEKVLFSKGIVFFENEKPVVLKGTVTDVTERSNINKRLTESEDRYHKMIDEVQDYAIIQLTREGKIADWNLGAEKIKGYSEEEIIGKHLSIFYREKERQAMVPEKLLAEAVKNGRAHNEGWRQRKNGTVFWASVVITALHDAKGEVIGFTKVTRDLTEKKQAEDELRRYAGRLEKKNNELEAINKELESFSYIASHDLQEPLRNIKMFSNIIAEKDQEHLSDKGKQLLGRINIAAGRMQKLIDDLLTFSKTQPSSNEFVEVNLDKILDEIKFHHAESIQSGSLIIEHNHLPVVKGVPFQFGQLFENIIGNSIKYNKEKASIHVKITSTLVAGDDLMDKGAEAGKNYLQISFSDNGIGFDQKYANKIFEVFQRLHGKDEYLGTGIGLAICKKIVKNYGGFIYATGQEGLGATFFICLPT